VFKFCVVVVGDNYRQSTREESRSRVDAIKLLDNIKCQQCELIL